MRVSVSQRDHRITATIPTRSERVCVCPVPLLDDESRRSGGERVRGSGAAAAGGARFATRRRQGKSVCQASSLIMSSVD